MCCPSKVVRALFELVRMHRIVDLHDSRAEAIAHLADWAPVVEEQA